MQNLCRVSLTNKHQFADPAALESETVKSGGQADYLLAATLFA